MLYICSTKQNSEPEILQTNVQMEKKNKEISSKNQIISLLENGDYIKNPLVYAQIKGNMSHIQGNVYAAVVKAMQDRIDNSLLNRQNGKTDIMSEQEKQKELFSFTIPLASLNLASRDYDQVEESCRKMVEKSFTYRWKDKDGNYHTDINSIFTKISIPTETLDGGYTRRVGDIEVEMKTEVAQHLFGLNSGYITHLVDIFGMCRNVKTARLYIYLCQLNDKKVYKGVGITDYKDLKEYFGVMDRTSYNTYSVFKRDVLDKIKEELNELCTNGQVEFSFRYEPIYLNGKKRGNPDKIKFTLYPPIEAVEIEEGNGYKEIEDKSDNSSRYLYNSLEDYRLFKQLIERGNEWALSKQDTGKSFDLDEFRQELRKEGIID